MPKPLREEINDAVVRYLEHKLQTGDTVNVPDMAVQMAQCLVDMVMEQSEEQQAPLLAQIITTLGDEDLHRRGLIPTGRRDN